MPADTITPAYAVTIDGQAYLNTIGAAKFCGLSIAEFHRRVEKFPERFQPKKLGTKCTRFKVAVLIEAVDSFGETVGVE